MSSEKLKIASLSERKAIYGRLRALSNVQWQEKTEQYCDYRLDGQTGGGWLRVKQYANGTLFLEAATDAMMARLLQIVQDAPEQTPLFANADAPSKASARPAGGKPVSSAPKADGELDLSGTYLGSDESGKGDYFGPLVVAGVVVTDETVVELRRLGVADSKTLTAQKIDRLGPAIVEIVGEANVAVVELAPARYNSLYAEFKASGRNLNHMLAWGHATVIETLLEASPDCQALESLQAVADKFGSDHYILSQLKAKGRQIKLHQVHRAEANIGVAAASIVARHRFVQHMATLGERFGLTLPLGASAQVERAARQLVARHGQDVLSKVAKCHFRTTDVVLGRTPQS
jgi:ribonuclease HIII